MPARSSPSAILNLMYTTEEHVLGWYPLLSDLNRYDFFVTYIYMYIYIYVYIYRLNLPPAGCSLERCARHSLAITLCWPALESLHVELSGRALWHGLNTDLGFSSSPICAGRHHSQLHVKTKTWKKQRAQSCV
jgi:hypothetical protein